MPTSLTNEEFSQHLNTKFRVKLETAGPIELELVEVKGYASKPEEQRGMERFSVFFQGPENGFLPQHAYSVEHDLMGAFDIFLVPIARDEKSVRYEAVFNYFK